jgi:hypothetical protein
VLIGRPHNAPAMDIDLRNRLTAAARAVGRPADAP